jgi:hypothetical protein
MRIHRENPRIGGIYAGSAMVDGIAHSVGWRDPDCLRLAMTMAQKMNRVCESCGYLTEERYTEEEWDATGGLCEDCAIGELADESIDDDILSGYASSVPKRSGSPRQSGFAR